MQDLWVYVSETGVLGVAIFVGYKYVIPTLKALYKELKDLRQENAELKEKLAYFKGKYTDKVILKSHGKKKHHGREEGKEEI
jgi:hypothetical protein